jgi:cytidylate kinase
VSHITPVITVDGPSGSGKGTISQLLAKKFDWHFLDSGALYRTLAYAAKKHNIDLEDAEALVKQAQVLDLHFKVDADHHNSQIIFEAEDVTEKIRDETVGVAASKIAVHQSVRDALMQRQRDFQRPPGLVADGRDMGTVVFPEARHKFFLGASLEERALRRFKQLKQKGELTAYEDILADLSARDYRDKERIASPLKPAEDAVVIDTTGLSIDQVMQKVLDKIYLYL